MKGLGRYSKNSCIKVNKFFDQPATSIQDAEFLRYNNISSDMGYPSNIYSFVKNLGDGSSSTIFEGIINETQEKIIIKKISKREYWVKELDILKKMKDSESGRILKLIGFFENQSFAYIVTEFYPGFDLFSHVNLNRPYKECQGMAIITEMAKAIKVCHDSNMIHLDIKCENYQVSGNDILFNEDGKLIGKIILIDFGHSEIYKDTERISKLKQGYSYGTHYYTCPEGYYDNIYSSASDLWSLGICMSFILTGEFPYYGSRKEYYKNCMDRNICLDKNISKEAYCLLEQTLDPNPSKRIKIDEFILKAEKLI